MTLESRIGGRKGAYIAVTDPDLHQNQGENREGTAKGARRAVVDAFGNAPNRVRVVRNTSEK